MLLVEDLTLLLLDDETGTPAAAGTLPYTLGGAVLVELALDGHVEIDGDTVRATGAGRPGDPLLLEAYEKVAEKPRGTSRCCRTSVAPCGHPYGRRPRRLHRRGDRHHDHRDQLTSSPRAGLTPSPYGFTGAWVCSATGRPSAPRRPSGR